MLSILSCSNSNIISSNGCDGSTSATADQSLINTLKLTLQRTPKRPFGRNSSITTGTSILSNGSIFHGTYVTNFVFCLLIASLCFECIGARSRPKGEWSEGRPCICNGSFYKSCPKSDECKDGRVVDLPDRYPFMDDDDDDVGNLRAVGLADVDYDDHDLHPDHNDKLLSRLISSSSRLGSRRKLFGTDDLYRGTLNSTWLNEDWQGVDEGFSLKGVPKLDGNFVERSGAIPLDTDRRVVRHRKVYMRNNPKLGDAAIHPIQITIRARAPEDVDEKPPSPKPIYRMQKFTTYETKPEVHMVPVTKTIIRPAGVSSDQIIGDEQGETNIIKGTSTSSSILSSSSSSLSSSSRSLSSLPRLISTRK